MSDKRTTVSIVSDDGQTEILKFTWDDRAAHFTMEANPYLEGMGEDEAVHILSAAGEIYRAMVGHSPAYYFSEDDE